MNLKREVICYKLLPLFLLLLQHFYFFTLVTEDEHNIIVQKRKKVNVLEYGHGLKKVAAFIVMCNHIVPNALKYAG